MRGIFWVCLFSVSTLSAETLPDTLATSTSHKSLPSATSAPHVVHTKQSTVDKHVAHAQVLQELVAMKQHPAHKQAVLDAYAKGKTDGFVKGVAASNDPKKVQVVNTPNVRKSLYQNFWQEGAHMYNLALTFTQEQLNDSVAKAKSLYHKGIEKGEYLYHASEDEVEKLVQKLKKYL